MWLAQFGVPGGSDLPAGLWVLLVAGAVTLALTNIGRFIRWTGVDRAVARMVLALLAPMSELVANAVEARIDARLAPVWSELRPDHEPLKDVLADEIEERLDCRLAPVWAELKPNGGTSLRDAVDRVGTTTLVIEQKLDAHLADVAAHSRDPHAHRRDDDVPDDGHAGPRPNLNG